MPAYRLMMTADAVGGVWRYALDLARGLAEFDVVVTLAVLGPSPSASQRKEAEAVCNLVETGLPLDWLCEDRDELANASAALARLARRCRATLVQSNSPLSINDPSAFDAPIAAFHHSCLATWWSAVKGGAFPAEWSGRREMTQAYLSAVASVAAPSLAFAQATSMCYDLPCPPHVIFNGRPPAPPAVAQTRQALLTAGRLWDEGKDIETLERAARRLRAPTYAAGPRLGPNGAQVRLESVRHLGDLDEAVLRALLAERPLFVSPSLYEPFGLAVLEAAQAGCALLLADIPTFRELWDGAALFFACRDDATLAEMASDLLVHPAERERLGAAARARAEAYDLSRCILSTSAWHRQILSTAPQRDFAA